MNTTTKYNFGLKITIGTTYKGVIVKVVATTLANALTQVATIFGVQTSNITVDAVAYVQEVLMDETSSQA